MKFAVSAGEFDSALKSVQGRTRAHKIIPILNHVLVSASESNVSVLGHDLDSSSFASLDAEVTLPGSWAIPGDPLIKVIGGLQKSAHATIELDVALARVTVKSGRSRYVIPVMSALDFPDALSAKDGFSFDVTADELEQLFSRPSGVADPARAYLNGIYLHDDGGKLHSCATDGHSLLRFGTEISSEGLDCAVSPGHNGVIVPNSSLSEIVKIGAGTISVTERTIEIVNGSRSYCSKLVDGTFPDYRRVIPELCADHFAIDREALVESLLRLDSIEGFSECGIIDATFGDGEVSITLTGIANGAEVIECETTGEVGFFCLQTRHLLNACKTLSGDRIDIYVRDPGSPIRIVDTSEPDAICIEMPCHSKNRETAAVAA